MYLRLRKRRKPIDSNTPAEGDTPAAGAQPAADASSGDWVEADSAPSEPGNDTELGTSKQPNRGNARESARGSH